MNLGMLEVLCKFQTLAVWYLVESEETLITEREYFYFKHDDFFFFLCNHNWPIDFNLGKMISDTFR